jgi:type I restriction enzyme, S subunit
MNPKNLNTDKIPTLRFPEFNGEWEKKKLGEVADFKVTNSFSRENLNYENGIVKNIHYGDIHTKFQTLFDITKEQVPFVNEEMNVNRISDDFYCKEGDLIFADASEDLNDVGKSIEIVNLNNEKLISGLHTLLARPKENIFSKGFNGYLLKSNNVRLQIQKEAQGSKVLGISIARIKGINLNFPTLPEQTKIAAFLTAVDEKIQALKKKKSGLENYKKGVMQKLFSSALGFVGLEDDRINEKKENDESNPTIIQSNKPKIRQLRFKDENGNDFPDWEVKKLGEVLSIPEKIKPLVVEKNKLLTVKLHLKGLFRNESTEGLSIGATIYFERYKGQFIYGKQNLFNGAFGIIPEEFDKFLTSADVPALNIDYLKINSTYLLNYLGREIYYKKLEDIASGSGSKRIHENTFLNVEIPIPCVAEQTAIANFLSAIDDKINKNNTQITQTETWKKGLLQKMFV